MIEAWVIGLRAIQYVAAALLFGLPAFLIYSARATRPLPLTWPRPALSWAALALALAAPAALVAQTAMMAGSLNEAIKPASLGMMVTGMGLGMALAVRPGMLEYEATIGARIDDDPDIAIDGCRLEALVIRNLDRMAAILTDLGLSGPALVSVTLDGTEDVILTRARASGRRLRQPQIVLPPLRIVDLGSPLGGDLQETLDMSWLSGGWPDGSPSFQGQTWAGYGDAAPYRHD